MSIRVDLGATTAYAIAVKNGFEGTEKEWLASLKGDTGAKGADGVSPTVTVENIDGGHRVTFTDASDSHAVDVLDGKPGKDVVVDATLTQDG
nr:MAG TPA: hypothetical protein [Bacteriophage sp.]